MSYAEDRGQSLYAGLNAMAAHINTWAVSKGFASPATIHGDDGERMLCKLMLVVTELAEAAEAVRNGNEANFSEEVADSIIRLLQICGGMYLDIETAVEVKMLVNEKRPHLHGKKLAI